MRRDHFQHAALSSVPIGLRATLRPAVAAVLNGRTAWSWAPALPGGERTAAQLIEREWFAAWQPMPLLRCVTLTPLAAHRLGVRIAHDGRWCPIPDRRRPSIERFSPVQRPAANCVSLPFPDRIAREDPKSAYADAFAESLWRSLSAQSSPIEPAIAAGEPAAEPSIEPAVSAEQPGAEPSIVPRPGDLFMGVCVSALRR